MSYNGWSNYETWAVNLWMTNDENSYHYYYDELGQAANGNVGDLARMLKEDVESNNPLVDQADMYADLMNAAISEVDWHEIAKTIIDDLEDREWQGDSDEAKEGVK